MDKTNHKNQDLQTAKKDKVDEFYTSLVDIEKELRHYTKHFKNKKVICTKCKKHFALEEMDADHIVLWKDGGKTTDDNCQVLCVPCNRGG